MTDINQRSNRPSMIINSNKLYVIVIDHLWKDKTEVKNNTDYCWVNNCSKEIRAEHQIFWSY